ncbi:Farnesylated proteins-converting enzyme 2 [Plasmodiophora brassicae]
MILSEACPRWASALICLLLAVAFVASLYVWARATMESRDHPDVVVRRIVSVSVVSSLAPLALLACASHQDGSPPFSAWMGLPFTTSSPLSWLAAVTLPLAVTASLFLGPIVQESLEYQSLQSWAAVGIATLWAPSQRLLRVRNLIVGPFCEEWVFRATMCSLMYGTGWSLTPMVLVPPVLFGLAHVHHLIDMVRSRGMSLAQGTAAVVVQLTYTTAFGVYACFIFIRTGHFISCFLCHAFCNLMGFPDLSWVSDEKHRRHRALLIVSYVSGIIIFSVSLAPLTAPHLYGSMFSPPPADPAYPPAPRLTVPATTLQRLLQT